MHYTFSKLGRQTNECKSGWVENVCTNEWIKTKNERRATCDIILEILLHLVFIDMNILTLGFATRYARHDKLLQAVVLLDLEVPLKGCLWPWNNIISAQKIIFWIISSDTYLHTHTNKRKISRQNSYLRQLVFPCVLPPSIYSFTFTSHF